MAMDAEFATQLGINPQGLGNIESVESFLNDEPEIQADPKDIIPNKEEEEVVDVKPDLDLKVDAEGLEELLFSDEKSDEDKAGAGDEPEKEVVDEPAADAELAVNVFEKLSNDLFELGVFTKETDDEASPGTPEDFLNKFNTEQVRRLAEYIAGYKARFGEDRVRVFEDIFEKGVDPRQYLQTYAELLNLAEVDLTDEGAQEAIFREASRRKGWDPEKIENRVAKLREQGRLEEEAQFEYDNLIEADKKSLETQATQKAAELAAAEEAQRAYETSIGTILKEKAKLKNFDGIPVTEKTQKEVFDYLNFKAWKLPSGELLTDFDKFWIDLKKPENYELRVKVALLAKNNFDLSKVKQTAITQETNEIFKNLAQKTVKEKSSQKTTKEKNLFTWNL